MKPPGRRWYRRLQVQLWLWAVFPLVLALVAVTLTNIYGHQRAMREFVSERDTALAALYTQQIEDALSHATVRSDGSGLSEIILEPWVARRGIVYVVDTIGNILFHPNALLIGTERGAELTVRQALQQSRGTVTGSLADGSPTLASFATVSGTGWRVIVEEPIEDVIVPVLRFSSALPILLLGATLLSLSIIYFSYRTIVRPLRDLSQAADRASGGELVLPEDVEGVEEIRNLQFALSAMVDRIRRYQSSTRDYVDRVTESQEAERSRLSRELHDQTVQDLIAVTQRLQMTRRALDRGQTEPAVSTLEEARLLCRKALDELRRMIQALRPAYLEDLGFLPALEVLVQEIDLVGPRADLSLHGQPRRLPDEVEVAAFRVAQEALANAVHHAQARRIRLLVHFEPQEMVLSVEDDGVGFAPPNSPDELTRAGHFGLVGMRERVLLVHGRLHVHSEPGGGTVITAHFPA